MKRLCHLALTLLAALWVTTARAQIPTNGTDSYAGMRLTATQAHKVSGGMKVYASEEVRLADRWLSREKYLLTLGTTYKCTPWLSTGADYTFAVKRKNRGDFSPMHRISAAATLSADIGRWELSLRETLQMTNRPGDTDLCKHARNEVDLKSRAKVRYSISKRWKPYAFAEMKLVLNGPSLGDYLYDSSIMRYTTPDGSLYGEPLWFIDGYDDISVSRWRFGAGMEHKIDKKNAVKFYAMHDLSHNLRIKSASDGTVLRSLAYTPHDITIFGLEYTHNF